MLPDASWWAVRRGENELKMGRTGRTGTKRTALRKSNLITTMDDSWIMLVLKHRFGKLHSHGTDDFSVLAEKLPTVRTK